MRFEVSERIRTEVSQEELLCALESQFRNVSRSVLKSGQTLEAKGVETSLGSINRNDITTISLKKVNDGWLVVAEVHYRPSVAFWIFLITTLFTWVLWLLPIVFYVLQKKTVRRGIMECLQRVKNECDRSLPIGETVGSKPAKLERLSVDDLEKYAVLKEKGIITAEEFEVAKRRFLGLNVVEVSPPTGSVPSVSAPILPGIEAPTASFPPSLERPIPIVGPSRRSWTKWGFPSGILLLGLIGLLGFVALDVNHKSVGVATISFSRFYSEGVEGRHRSVTLTGSDIEGTYKVPFTNGNGEPINKFKTCAPPMQDLGKAILSWKQEGLLDEFWCDKPSMLPKFLRLSAAKAGVATIPFSQFYFEGVEGRYRSVTLTGADIEGTYKVPFTNSKGESIKKFRTCAPPMPDLGKSILSWKQEGQLDELNGGA